MPSLPPCPLVVLTVPYYTTDRGSGTPDDTRLMCNEERSDSVGIRFWRTGFTRRRADPPPRPVYALVSSIRSFGAQPFSLRFCMATDGNFLGAGVSFSSRRKSSTE